MVLVVKNFAHEKVIWVVALAIYGIARDPALMAIGTEPPSVPDRVWAGITPAASPINCEKFGPFNGKLLMFCWPCRLERVVLSVCSMAAAPCTLTSCVAAPTCMEKSVTLLSATVSVKCWTSLRNPETSTSTSYSPA